MAIRNLNINPDDLARTFSQYVRAVVRILVWSTIAVISVAATYLAMRILWIVVQMVLRAVGA
jgi:hypothetical protein